jgi:hypothetical protein
MVTSVRRSVRKFKIENFWTDFYEILHGLKGEMMNVYNILVGKHEGKLTLN